MYNYVINFTDCFDTVYHLHLLKAEHFGDLICLYLRSSDRVSPFDGTNRTGSPYLLPTWRWRQI